MVPKHSVFKSEKWFPSLIELYQDCEDSRQSGQTVCIGKLDQDLLFLSNQATTAPFKFLRLINIFAIILIKNQDPTILSVYRGRSTFWAEPTLRRKP